MKNNNLSKHSNDNGVTAVIVALLLTLFLGIAVLAVDIGYYVMVKNQLQNAADAAALAGARQLGNIYKNMTSAELDAQQNSSTLSQENNLLVVNTAKNTASANKAAGVPVTLEEADVVIGIWNATAKTVTSGNFPLAVQVKARNNNISTFFAQIFGKQTMGLEVVATAALTAQCTGGKSPFTIAHSWFEPNNCPTDYLTWEGNDGNGANAGITNCVAWRGNKQDVMPIMQCINGTNNNCPDSQVDGEVPYSNGMINNLFDKSNPVNLLGLFDYMKDKDNDGSNSTWTTEVEITDFTCGQGSGSSSKVWGYATIVISDVMIQDPKFPGNPNKQIRALKFTTDCKVVQDGRGGGCNGPNIGDIPSLVQ